MGDNSSLTGHTHEIAAIRKQQRSNGLNNSRQIKSSPTLIFFIFLKKPFHPDICPSRDLSLLSLMSSWISEFLYFQHIIVFIFLSFFFTLAHIVSSFDLIPIYSGSVTSRAPVQSGATPSECRKAKCHSEEKKTLIIRNHRNETDKSVCSGRSFEGHASLVIRMFIDADM